MSEVRKGTSRNTENENKRCKIFNKVLNMNWDYVRGKKNQKENENKQKRKQTNKNKLNKIKKKFIRQFGSVCNKKMVKSVIYLLFSYQTGYKMRLREYRS
jgi:predicted transcriptional regulator